jgi:hypothetical protein
MDSSSVHIKVTATDMTAQVRNAHTLEHTDNLANDI